MGMKRKPTPHEMGNSPDKAEITLKRNAYLMAVSVNEYNVVGAQQGLANNLVCGRRAVGDKVCVV